MSEGNFLALLVEEDFRCPVIHYFRHIKQRDIVLVQKLSINPKKV
jgi:hypothetical protein